ncbi:MAG: PAS domain-containing protein, partial [Desulfuromonadales bacterium]|nr:PAS domain-containing protein [Desulfuromonadales bacterium]
IKTASEAVRLGAFDYITKPLHQDELLRQAKLAVDHKELLDRQETYQLRMAAVFQSIREGLLIFDGQMKLVEINAAASKLLGCDQELLGQSLEQLSQNSPSLKMLQELIEFRCEGEIFRQEVSGVDGQVVTVGLTMAPLTSHVGSELGTVLVVRDETQPVRQV